MTDATQSREAVEALAADLDELGVDVIDVVLDPDHLAERGRIMDSSDGILPTE